MCILCSDNINTTITFLDCSGCQNVKSVPDIFPELIFLVIYNTNIETLPASSNKLKGLYMYNTKVKFIPDYPNVRVIHADNTPLTRISAAHVNLEKLFIKNTQVSELPDNLININTLECDFTPMTKLSPKWLNMESLTIANTEISEIPIYKYLIFLDCSRTPVVYIDSDISRLRHLNCVGTNITNIPDDCNCHM